MDLKHLMIFALALVLGSINVNGGGTAGFDYDCSQKEDGDYAHPTKCTHFVTCVARTEAYEIPCQIGENGKLLHWVQNSGPSSETSHCDHPGVAGCDDGNTPSDGKPNPE